MCLYKNRVFDAELAKAILGTTPCSLPMRSHRGHRPWSFSRSCSSQQRRYHAHSPSLPKIIPFHQHTGETIKSWRSNPFCQLNENPSISEMLSGTKPYFFIPSSETGRFAKTSSFCLLFIFPIFFVLRF